MKKVNLVLTSILVGGLVACSQTQVIPRDRLKANLSSILEVEERADQVKAAAQMLGSVGKINPNKAKELKSHYDVFYVHYLAASVYLAQGNVEFYMDHVKQAEKELDAMEAMLTLLPSDPDKHDTESGGASFPSSSL